MRRRYFIPLTLILAIFLVGSAAARVDAREVPRMTPEELRMKHGDPQVIIIDVRSDSDWNRSRTKIGMAIRENPRRFDWAQKYAKDSTLVLYCT